MLLKFLIYLAVRKLTADTKKSVFMKMRHCDHIEQLVLFSAQSDLFVSQLITLNSIRIRPNLINLQASKKNITIVGVICKFQW